LFLAGSDVLRFDLVSHCISVCPKRVKLLQDDTAGDEGGRRKKKAKEDEEGGGPPGPKVRTSFSLEELCSWGCEELLDWIAEHLLAAIRERQQDSKQKPADFSWGSVEASVMTLIEWCALWMNNTKISGRTLLQVTVGAHRRYRWLLAEGLRLGALTIDDHPTTTTKAGGAMPVRAKLAKPPSTKPSGDGHASASEETTRASFLENVSGRASTLEVVATRSLAFELQEQLKRQRLLHQMNQLDGASVAAFVGKRNDFSEESKPEVNIGRGGDGSSSSSSHAGIFTGGDALVLDANSKGWAAGEGSPPSEGSILAGATDTAATTTTAFRLHHQNKSLDQHIFSHIDVGGLAIDLKKEVEDTVSVVLLMLGLGPDARRLLAEKWFHLTKPLLDSFFPFSMSGPTPAPHRPLPMMLTRIPIAVSRARSNDSAVTLPLKDNGDKDGGEGDGDQVSQLEVAGTDRLQRPMAGSSDFELVSEMEIKDGDTLLSLRREGRLIEALRDCDSPALQMVTVLVPSLSTGQLPPWCPAPRPSTLRLEGHWDFLDLLRGGRPILRDAEEGLSPFDIGPLLLIRVHQLAWSTN
jgi:hypothetical protein